MSNDDKAKSGVSMSQWNSEILSQISATLSSATAGGVPKHYVFRRDGTDICMVLRDTLNVEGATRVFGPATFVECITKVNERAFVSDAAPGEQESESERDDAE